MQISAENAPKNSDDAGWLSHRIRNDLPVLLTVDEAASFLRTTRRAIYAMIERRQLPGVIRIRRRVLVRADALLPKRAPSPKE